MTQAPRPEQWRTVKHEYNSRDYQLERLGFARGERGYDAYLRSPRWLAGGRARLLALDAPQVCFVCWGERCHAHHRTYRNLGREPVSDLVWLCGNHHRAVHTLAESMSYPLYVAHAMERQAFWGRRLVEREQNLVERASRAAERGLLGDAVRGGLSLDAFQVLPDAMRVSLRFVDAENAGVYVSLTCPNGAKNEPWELRQDHDAPWHPEDLPAQAAS
jgi:hypothetical protein